MRKVTALHVPKLWGHRQRAGSSPDLTSLRDHKACNCVKAVPHHGERVVACQNGVFSSQAGCYHPNLLQLTHKSLADATGLMKEDSDILEEGRLRRNLLPSMPYVRGSAIEDDDLCL